jgi:hypothetical protein
VKVPSGDFGIRRTLREVLLVHGIVFVVFVSVTPSAQHINQVILIDDGSVSTEGESGQRDK